MSNGYYSGLEEARAHAPSGGVKAVRVLEVDGSGKNAASLREVLRPRGQL